MDKERRAHERGKAGGRVTFTDATSDKPLDGELHDISRGGMFVVTTANVPTGKRIEFEIRVTPVPVAGMGRVVWTREATPASAAGIGVKFIDVDDASLVVIDQMRAPKKVVRERTLMGIAPPAVAKTMLGMAPGAPREQELSWPDEPPNALPEPPPPSPEPPPDSPKPLPPPSLEAPSIAKPAGPPAPRELPKRENKSSFPLVIAIVMFVVIGALVATLMRDQIFGTKPGPSVSVSSVASTPPLASVTAAPPVSVALPPSATEDQRVDPAAIEPQISTTLDASARDGSRDGGRHHARDGGRLHHAHAGSSALAPGAAGDNNPY